MSYGKSADAPDASKEVRAAAKDAELGETSPEHSPEHVGMNTASDPHRGGPVPTK